MSRRLALIIGNSRLRRSWTRETRRAGRGRARAWRGAPNPLTSAGSTRSSSSSTKHRPPSVAPSHGYSTSSDATTFSCSIFSGHGIRDDQGQLYLATRETERNLLAAKSGEASFGTARWIAAHEGARPLFSTAPQRTVRREERTRRFNRNCGSLRGHWLRARRADGHRRDAVRLGGRQVVGAAEPSLFTNFLVLGIQSGAADLNGDGEVTIDELYEYTYEEVVNSTSKQVPGKWAFKQQGGIVIARNPLGSPASPLPQALIDKIASDVESLHLEAIRDLAVSSEDDIAPDRSQPEARSRSSRRLTRPGCRGGARHAGDVSRTATQRRRPGVRDRSGSRNSEGAGGVRLARCSSATCPETLRVRSRRVGSGLVGRVRRLEMDRRA